MMQGISGTKVNVKERPPFFFLNLNPNRNHNPNPKLIDNC